MGYGIRHFAILLQVTSIVFDQPVELKSCLVLVTRFCSRVDCLRSVLFSSSLGRDLP